MQFDLTADWMRARTICRSVEWSVSIIVVRHKRPRMATLTCYCCGYFVDLTVVTLMVQNSPSCPSPKCIGHTRYTKSRYNARVVLRYHATCIPRVEAVLPQHFPKNTRPNGVRTLKARDMYFFFVERPWASLNH